MAMDDNYWIYQLPVDLQVVVRRKTDEFGRWANRIAEEIRMYETDSNWPLKSAREFDNMRWQCKHRQLTIAFAYDRMKMIEREVGHIKVLYGSK